MHRSVAVVVACVALTGGAGGESHHQSLMMKEREDRPVTGNLRMDLFGQTELANAPPVAPGEESPAQARKSPYIAAGLSLAVPGAGQFYTEHYWEAVAFVAADVAAWILAYHYDRKGDKQTDFFQNYADAHWSVVDYAQYAQDNLVPYIPDPNGRTFRWLKPGTEGYAPWIRVDWNELNRMERAIGGTDQGRYYSHTLPPHGDQQYYELVGKYGQFNQGWDDRPPTYQYLDPVTPHFSYYSGERGKANEYYNTATTWVTVAIINHVVSAVHAGFAAGWYNSTHVELGLQRVPTERGFTNVPVVKMRLEF